MGYKIIVSVGLFLLGISAAFSQEIPLQLMLVDSNGFEKVNQNVKLRLTMSNDTSLTTGQYQEVHITQSNEFGIIGENLGSGVATTNSQVLSLEQFAFLTDEPLIKIELDTSSASNQYYTVGYVPYSYPMVARRALSADSSNYSDQSINSEYADTAEFARNFNESYDDDTSATNEIQGLLLSPNGYLKLSSSSDSVLIQNMAHEGLISDLKGMGSDNSECYKGNPQVFMLDTLTTFNMVEPVCMFDSVGMFITGIYAHPSYSYYLLTINLYSGHVIGQRNWGTNHVVSSQNQFYAYIFENGSIYQLNSQCSYVDTISSSSSSPIVKDHFVAFENGDLTWLNGNTISFLNSVNDSITSTSMSISALNLHRLSAVGRDSLLLDDSLIKPSDGSTLNQYSFQDASTTQFFFSKSNKRIVYRIINADNRWYHCNLGGLDNEVLLWDNGGTIDMYNVNIEGMMLFRTSTHSSSNHFIYNNYLANIPAPAGTSGYTNTPEWLCVDMNGHVFQVVPNRNSGDFLSLGEFTVRYSNSFECIAGSDIFQPGKLIRWARN